MRRVSQSHAALVGIANLLMMKGEKELALELLSLIRHHPASWQLAKDQATPLVARLIAESPSDVVAEAQEHGRARDLNAAVAEHLGRLEE